MPPMKRRRPREELAEAPPAKKMPVGQTRRATRQLSGAPPVVPQALEVPKRRMGRSRRITAEQPIVPTATSAPPAVKVPVTSDVHTRSGSGSGTASGSGNRSGSGGHAKMLANGAAPAAVYARPPSAPTDVKNMLQNGLGPGLAHTSRATRTTRHTDGNIGLSETVDGSASKRPVGLRQGSGTLPSHGNVTALLATLPLSHNNLPSRPAPPAPAVEPASSVNPAPTRHPRQRSPLPQKRKSFHEKFRGRMSGGHPGTPEKRGARADRNVDKVVFGPYCFSAWYPSYYTKERLGDTSGVSGKVKSDLPNGNGPVNGDGAAASFVPYASSQAATLITNGVGYGGLTAAAEHEADQGGKGQSRRDRDHQQPMLSRLYVCPYCFIYSKEVLSWRRHLDFCERRGKVPGRKIYTHPKQTRPVLIPAPPRPARRKKGEPGQTLIQRYVPNEGEWSIWEVDGEKEVMFCQDLSLFGKLFLDNKSVCFDITSFNYFLLVYTPRIPVREPGLVSGPREAAGPEPQIIGFFSKEKLSWDNNTLACILIFPPWQKKGLGSLLMGVSYEISRREGILGGPEKPISDLGKKGYMRYWEGEIARWLLTEAYAEESEGKSPLSVEDCSRATWIAIDDCICTLREMGLVEDDVESQSVEMPSPQELTSPEDEIHKEEGKDDDKDDEGRAPGGKRPTTISRERIIQWAEAKGRSMDTGMDTSRACDPDGFIEGYAIPPKGDVEDEEEEEQEQEQEQDGEMEDADAAESC